MTCSLVGHVSNTRMKSHQTFKHVNYTINVKTRELHCLLLLHHVIGFLTSPSFHNSIGIVLPSSLPTSSPLLSWFSARCRSPFASPFFFLLFSFSLCPLLFIFSIVNDIGIVHGQVWHPTRFFLFTTTKANTST